MRQQILVAFVGLLGVAHASVLAHGPQPPAIHGGLNAAGVGKFAGKADLLLATLALFSRRVQRLNFDAGAGMRILAGGHVRLLWPGHQDFLTARRARQNALAPAVERPERARQRCVDPLIAEPRRPPAIDDRVGKPDGEEGDEAGSDDVTQEMPAEGDTEQSRDCAEDGGAGIGQRAPLRRAQRCRRIGPERGRGFARKERAVLRALTA